MIVGDIIPRNTRLLANETAIVVDGREISFAQYAERSYRLANALIDRGLARQERVAVVAQNCPEYLEIYGAGEIAGFIVNAVNCRLARPELVHVIGNADPAVVFFEARFAESVAAIREDLPGVRHYVQIGAEEDLAPGCEPYEAFLATGAPERPASRPEQDDTAYLIYTSGTTGRPKGVMLGQRAQWLTALMIGYDFGLTALDRWLLVMPLFHVGAKYQQLAYHLTGARVYLHRRFDAEAVVEAIERDRITVAHFAPTMLQAVLDLPDLARRDLTSLRTISYGAAPMPVPLLRRSLDAFGPVLVQRYGATESAAVSFLDKHHHMPDGTPEQVRLLASAGQANVMTELKIIRDDGGECASGEPGELLISNPELVMQGYWRDPEATREVMRDGWYHSGDIGTLDENEFLTIIDRKKEMIISGGENISPREVEEALVHHEAVESASVIGVPDDKWGETVLAFVVLNKGAKASGEALIEFCRTRIAGYKKPSAIEFRDSLPLLASGKVDKVRLKEPYWVGRGRRL